MNTRLTEIQDLLNTKSELEAHLALIPFEGTPEVKEAGGRKYVSVRKRVRGKLSSKYVGPYSETLFNQLLLNTRKAKELRARIRRVDARLSELGYTPQKPSPSVIKNIEFARSEIKPVIYSQAVLEGFESTFEDAEPVLDNGVINNMKGSDIRKIMNLKNAWEFILGDSVITMPTDLALASYVAKIVNEGFYRDGGRLRAVPVDPFFFPCDPPVPDAAQVEKDLQAITEGPGTDAEKATDLCLYILGNLLFYDGNKRTAILVANHFLISRAAGVLVVPHEKADEFKRLLGAFRKTGNAKRFKEFLLGCVSEPV